MKPEATLGKSAIMCVAKLSAVCACSVRHCVCVRVFVRVYECVRVRLGVVSKFSRDSVRIPLTIARAHVAYVS